LQWLLEAYGLSGHICISVSLKQSANHFSADSRSSKLEDEAFSNAYSNDQRIEISVQIIYQKQLKKKKQNFAQGKPESPDSHCDTSGKLNSLESSVPYMHKNNSYIQTKAQL
jgi:hypothetical protein